MEDMKKYFVAGFDVLGYSKRLREGDKHLFPLINDAVAFVNDELAQKYEFGFKMFSDNIIFYSENNFEGVLLATALVQAKLACSGLFIRGAILYDDLVITKDFVYGESLIKTAELESVANYPRIIVVESCINAILSTGNKMESFEKYLIKHTDDNRENKRDSVEYHVDYLEMLKNISRNEYIEIKFGEISEKTPFSFNDELDAHRLYVEEELIKCENELKIAMMSNNLKDIEVSRKTKNKFIWVKKYHNEFCIKHGYYPYLIVGDIRGNTLNFNNAEIGVLDCNFNIDLSKKRFDIIITDVEIIYSDFINKMDWKMESITSNYVLGEDAETGLKFTLCDCQVAIARINLKSPQKDGRFCRDSVEICIFWDSIIVGQHISDVGKMPVTEMFVLAESKKQWFSYSIGKSVYKIENESIDVSVDFFELKRNLYKSWNIAKKGCLFGFKSRQPISLNKMKESYRILLDLYYLLIGFYPENARFWCVSEHGSFIHISHSDGFMKSKIRDINLERNLYCSNMEVISYAYDKWVQIYNEYTPIFTVYKRAVCDIDEICEILTAKYIQCLEAYIRQKHNYQNKALADVILLAINYNDCTKNVIRNVEDFISRVAEHRKAAELLDFPSNGNYFKERENTAVCKKIELLLRLCLLHDVGLDVKKDSVDNYVVMIEREYPMK